MELLLPSLTRSPHESTTGGSESPRLHLKLLGGNFACSQSHEDDVAKLILMHEPDMPNVMGTLHPEGSLYENTVDVAKAQEEHRNVVKMFQQSGVKVVTVREILKAECHTDMKERLKLEKFAIKCLKYQLQTESDVSLLSSQDKFLLSDEYKEKILAEMNVDQLVDIILTNPTISLRKSDINTALSSTSISFSPLSNLVFCRDQQITTRKGVILGQPNSTTRAGEVAITQFCFEKIGLNIIGKIPSPGKLEGGDFFPMGEDLCMIGMGLRTNMFAVNYCMDNDLFGTKRVAVVKDPFDWSQERMHLDTVFNIVNRSVVVLLETVIGGNSEIRRVVDVYEQSESDKKYRLVRSDVEFSEYLTELGYHIIPLSLKDHQNYGLNFLNIGNGDIICPDVESARKIARSEYVHGRIEVVDYKNIARMYGAVHCSTQVLVRQPMEKISPRNTAAVPQEVPTKSPIPSPFPPKKNKPLRHTTDSILMVPPTCFFYNVQTASDNTFMNAPKLTKHEVQRAAMKEYSKFHRTLTRDWGINVHLAINTNGDAPDSVYPNNWFSTHNAGEQGSEDNTIVLYPMKHETRRRERTVETIRRLTQNYTNVIDLTYHETSDSLILEGTGALVLDRVNKIAYICESQRADLALAQEWCTKLGFKLHSMGIAVDKHDSVVYHTNVVMSVGSKVAVVCADAVADTQKRTALLDSLSKTHKVITITRDQMHHFCGNVIELYSTLKQTNIMVMSETAYRAFTPEQLDVMKENDTVPVHAELSTIEIYGGGGVRCCIAELF